MITRRPILSIVDYGQLFNDDPDAKAVPIDEATVFKKQNTTFIKQILREGTTDLMFAASCECGTLVGNFYKNMICDECQTIVDTNFANDLQYNSWIVIPEFMPPIIQPTVFKVLQSWMGKYQKQSLLWAFLDPSLPFPEELSINMKQGMRYFYANFDTIINFLLTKYKPLCTGTGLKRSKGIRQFVDENRGAIFSRELPILNKSLHLLTGENIKYTDESVQYILKAWMELAATTDTYHNGITGPEYIDERAARLMEDYYLYTKSIIVTKIASKRGYARKNVFGARVHFSSRAIIAPIAGEHHFDEIYIPWRMSVAMLRLEIINVLQQRMHYSMADAVKKHTWALTSYDPDIAKIMNDLISESPYKGLPVYLGRNPSLQYGAIQQVFTTKFKIDLNDNTIELSPLIIYAPNSDFDGDAMYLIRLFEMDLMPEYQKLHPVGTMVSGTSMELSDVLRMCPESVQNLNMWVHDEEGDSIKIATF